MCCDLLQLSFSFHSCSPVADAVERLVKKQIHSTHWHFLCFHIAVVLFSLPSESISIITYSSSFYPHTHLCTHITGGIFECVCASICSCAYMCKYTPCILEFKPPHTTRLLIYRCLYMFALAAAVVIDVVVVVNFREHVYFTFPFAMSCLPFSTRQIHHLKNPIQWASDFVTIATN